MNGLVIPHTPIAVDFWRPRAAPQAKLFFLSHMHTGQLDVLFTRDVIKPVTCSDNVYVDFVLDHTSGLSSSWSHQIFCSEISARLLKSTFRLPSELITVLVVGCPTLVPVDLSGEHFVTVTALDANHCPGSLMFLFEGYFGVILYTADFRYDDQFMNQDALQQIQDIDVLYLDNTYCDPRCVFPTREVSAAEIIRLIREHPDHEVFIGIHSLGKEWLLEQIALQTEQWIVVGETRFETLRAAQCLNVFSTDMDDSLLRVVKPQTLTAQNLEKWNTEYPAIAILPTAIFVGQDRQPPNGIYVVPYSDHSSYEELVQFVSKMQPKSVIAIVKSKHATDELKSRTDMSCFRPFLSSKPRFEFNIPCSVIDFMNGSGLSSQLKQLISIHRPSRFQRKRSIASGVVFSDSPLKEIQESKQTEETKSKELWSNETMGPSASHDGGPIHVDCVEVKVTDDAIDVNTGLEKGHKSDILSNQLNQNQSSGVEESQDAGGRSAVDEQDVEVVDVTVEDDGREEKGVVCSAGGEFVGVGVAVAVGKENEESGVRDSSSICTRSLPIWLNHSTSAVASEHSQAHNQTETNSLLAENNKKWTSDRLIDLTTEMDGDDDDDDDDVPIVARKRPRSVLGMTERQKKRGSCIETSKTRHLVCQSGGQRGSVHNHFIRQSKFSFVGRPQVKPTNATPRSHSEKPVNDNPTGKTFYEQFYVGRTCSFAKRLLFGE